MLPQQSQNSSITFLPIEQLLKKKLFDKDNRIKNYWLGTKAKQVVIAKVEASIQLQRLSRPPSIEHVYSEPFVKLWITIACLYFHVL